MKKKSLFTLLLIPFLFGCSSNESNPNLPGPVEPNNPVDPEKPTEKEVNDLTIFSLNDTHGDLLRDPDVKNYGIDGVYYQMKQEVISKKYEEPVLICTGDMFQGQFVSNHTRGAAIVDALNYMKMDAFVLGNHEFDWGLDQIQRFKDGDETNGELNCDILCANLIYKPTNSRPDWVKPYTIAEKAGHKLGIIGFMGEGLESSILAEMVKDYKFTDTAVLAEQYSKELREVHGCDSVIVGIHDYDINTFIDFNNLNTPIDGIFGGHTHQFNLDSFVRKADGLNIYSIQSGANNEGFSTINLKFNNDSTLKSTVAYQTKNINYGTDLDMGLRTFIEEKYAKEIRDSNEIISQNFPHKTKNGWGKFVTESMIGALGEGADVGYMNKGGIRNNTAYLDGNDTKLYAKQLFRILPFDNKIYQISIPKSVLDPKLTSSNKYNFWSKKDVVSEGSNYIVNVLDYVYDGAYDRDVWDSGTLIKTLDLNIRDFVATSIKGAK